MTGRFGVREKGLHDLRDPLRISVKVVSEGFTNEVVIFMSTCPGGVVPL